MVRDRLGARPIGNSFRFRQAAPWHAEAIVQWRIVVVFKQQKNLWLPPVAPGLLSIIIAVLRGQQPPRFISLFPGARTIQSPAGGGCVCEITQVASVAAATWYKPTTQLLSALQIQSRVAFSATATCGISFPPRRGLSRGDLTQPDQGELVQAASLHNRNHRGYLHRLEAPLTFGKKSCLIISWGGLASGGGLAGNVAVLDVVNSWF